MLNDDIISIDLVEGGRTIRQGDHFSIAVTPRNSRGEVLDLAGKLIEVALLDRTGIVYETTAEFDTSISAVRFSVTENIGHGKMRMEFTATDPGDPTYRRKFPARDYDGRLEINFSSDSLPHVGVRMVTVEQLRKEQQDAQDNYKTEVDQKIQTFKLESGLLKQQFNEAMGALTEDSEVVSARVGYNSLGDKLDAFTVKLADKTQEIISASKVQTQLSSLKRNEPITSFVDDDGDRAVLDKLLPLKEKYDVPFVVAMPSDFMLQSMLGERNGLKAHELKMLQDEHGFEIASHSKSHLRLDETAAVDNATNEEELISEIYGSWKTMREYGLNIESIVYPSGASSPLARSIVQKYYKNGIGTDTGSNGDNGQPIRTFNLRRYAFPKQDGTGTFEYYKAIQDQAIADGAWLIWMLHVGQSVHDDTQQQILDDLIAYTKTTSSKIVTATEAIDLVGNYIDIGEQELYVSKDGTNNIKDYEFAKINNLTGQSDFDFMSKPSDFPLGKVIATNVFNDNANSPSNSRGMLITYTLESEQTEAYQTFKSSSNYTFERMSNGSEAWTTWKNVFVGEKKILPINSVTIPANSGITKTYVINSFTDKSFFTLSPKYALPSGVLYSTSYEAHSVMAITFFNSTGASVTIPAGDWNLFFVVR